MYGLKLCALVYLSLWAVSASVVEVEQQIIWSNLTADELSKIEPEVFVNVTANDISQIPEDACKGFTSSQITLLNASAVCVSSSIS
jgi:hypothetical protein